MLSIHFSLFVCCCCFLFFGGGGWGGGGVFVMSLFQISRNSVKIYQCVCVRERERDYVCVCVGGG